jgi:uncharacterized repeat protein (TIGR02543 family)
LATKLGKTLGSSDIEINVYAQWTANTYTIKYNANGGSNAPSSTTYVYASKGNTTLTSGTPKRSGKKFVGWAKKSSASKADYSPGGSFPRSTVPSSGTTITLYAVWTNETYNVLNVRPNGGIWRESDGNTKFPGAPGSTISIEPPTREGYKFVGWYKTADGSFANELYKYSLFTSAKADNLPAVYNNTKGDTSVTMTRSEKTNEAGYGFQRVLTITTTGTTATPGRGGIRRVITPEKGATYVHSFRAKAPTGTTINAAFNNPYKTDSSGNKTYLINPTTGKNFKWLT